MPDAHGLRHQATRDGLTGLAHWCCLKAELARSIEAAGANRSDVLLHIDLDRFRVVNDRCERTTGNRLLRQVTGLLKAHVWEGDLVVRLDGDEFAIILRSRTVGQAHAVAGRICDDLDASRFNGGGGRFRVGASIGLVAVDRRDLYVAALARAADGACQAAQGSGPQPRPCLEGVRSRHAASVQRRVLAQPPGAGSRPGPVRAARAADRAAFRSRRQAALRGATSST